MYLRDGSTQTTGRAATLREKLQVKLSISEVAGQTLYLISCKSNSLSQKLRDKLCISEVAGQTFYLRSCWSNSLSQKLMVKLSISDVAGQTIYLRSCTLKLSISSSLSILTPVVVRWLFYIPATCLSIPPTGLLRQLDVLPH